MTARDLLELLPDREHRVEARAGALEDHRDLAATELSQILLGEGEDVAAVEDHASPRAGGRAGACAGPTAR